MNAARNSTSRSLLYLGAVAVIFLLGLGSGLAASGWWAGTPGSPTLVFVTAPPGPSPAVLAGTPQPGSDLCPPPAGWITYTIQPGDTLLGLAGQFNTSPNLIQQANCLADSQLLAGQPLFLPPVAMPTPCHISPPVGWESYTVQSGDTLYALAAARGTTVAALIQVNCLPSESIAVGDTLYLQALPTPTPTPLPPPTPVPTPLPPTPVSVASIPTPAPTVSVPTPAPIVSIPTAALLTLPPSTPADSEPSSGLDFGEAAQSPGGGQATFAAAGSPFTLKEGNIPAFILRPPDPNASEERRYLHCQPSIDPQAIPRPKLDAFPNGPLNNTEVSHLDLGQRRYFFLCNIPADLATVTITRSDGITRQLEIWPPAAVPGRVLSYSHQATGFVEWPALPFHPTGPYTLTVTDGSGTSFLPQSPTFIVTRPLTLASYILPIPAAGSPGTSFLIYYVNFDRGETLDFSLHYIDKPPQQPDDYDQLQLTHQTHSWPIPINEPLNGSSGKGWGVSSLSSSATDLQGTYVISSTNRDIYQPIWLQ